MELKKNQRSTRPKEDLIEQIRSAGLHPPETLTLMITDGCNLKCRHCLHDCRSPKDATLISAENIVLLVNDFVRLGGAHLNLTGGEFFSHPDCLPILGFCVNHPRIDGVCLQTNAALITAKLIKTIVKSDLELEKLTIQVSLDGVRPRTHDFVRGAGSYYRTLEGLHQLVENGLGSQTRVAFTEMAHNFDELPQLLEIVEKMEIAGLISSTLVKGGRAAGSEQIRLPVPAQYWELIHLYQTDPAFRKRYDEKATIAAIEWFKNRSAANTDDCSCLKNLFVDIKGRIFPCTMLLLERYGSESIYSRPVNSVLQEKLDHWREIPLLRRKRHNVLQPCSLCPGKSHCGGGCMGRAAASGGDLMEPEDRCALRKAVYHWTMLPSVDAFCHGRWEKLVD